MLIPHDRGARRSFEMTELHIWSFVGVLLLLCFMTGFLFQRNRMADERTHDLTARYVQLERSFGGNSSGILHSEIEARESAIRAEYEARDQTLTTELSVLYDLESEVRSITGLPPREQPLDISAGAGGGKGGQPGDINEMPGFPDEDLMRPPHAIYGLSSPSADLIVQEINIRTESLLQLLGSLEAQREQVARTPSIWPTKDEKRRVNSRFGRRKDPFTRRVRNHSGIDISASYGADVLVTARGVVRFSGRHQFLGNLVKVDHENGIHSWYGHLSKRAVKKGDFVERGDVIGKVGSTGRSTGPHIHYEIHVNGTRVDPQKYIGR